MYLFILCVIIIDFICVLKNSHTQTYKMMFVMSICHNDLNVVCFLFLSILVSSSDLLVSRFFVFFLSLFVVAFFTVTVAKLNKIFLKYWFGILIRLCLQISFFNKWKSEVFNEWKAELFSCAISLVRCFRVMWYSKWMTGIIRWLTDLISWLTGHIRSLHIWVWALYIIKFIHYKS